jgi:hypothetical protein
MQTKDYVTTVIQADNVHNARIMLAKLYGANNVMSVLQVN